MGRSAGLLLGYTSLLTNRTTFLVPLDGLNSRCEMEQYTLTTLPSLTTKVTTNPKTYIQMNSQKGEDISSVLFYTPCKDGKTGSCNTKGSGAAKQKHRFEDGTYRVALEVVENHRVHQNKDQKYGNVTFTHYRVRSIDNHPDEMIWVDLHILEDGKTKSIDDRKYVYLHLDSPFMHTLMFHNHREYDKAPTS